MEAFAGFGLRKVGVPLTALSVLLLLGVTQRWRVAYPLAGILGAVSTYYVAVAHYVPGLNVAWYGPLPWLTRPDVTGTWTVPYSVLIDVGLVVGLLCLWISTHAIREEFGSRALDLFVLTATLLFTALGFSRYDVHNGLWGVPGMIWALAIGLVPCTVMQLSALYNGIRIARHTAITPTWARSEGGNSTREGV